MECLLCGASAVPRDSTKLSHLRDSLCFLYILHEGMEQGT